ncbi:MULTISPECIES: TIGR04282 family arsenosugar biosynthesis glycosyltransferase [unclassified Cryobacterium]|uniref:TIGR04282 family arsenosugar biosynthesis glycosyltransferase n=1 Tax=unclassified Cryobacterium TaxID=2649013 RepID=UPI002AB40ACB|nr:MULTISPECIES: DUF2064 domain-containing protein [unclassified Cryobacterium]MDY7526702.1 DUF2064 domain-containing protein [Cryobacterium sp. 10C2]MDY7557492.1 DUF2064 domain-containing protein [Cryobacterium sp. 10C3]MEB0291491.1 DUF2064 domain-containing protein [Cryobacterium sp. 10C2]
MTALVVIAKECLPGRVKTRLHPALSFEQAAELAAASLDDTLTAALALPASRRILAFDGVTPPRLAAEFEILPQVAGGLDERLAAIFDGLDEPTVLIGMDTPQVTTELLAPVFTDWPDDTDAWLGLADDGGFWALALAAPRGGSSRGHSRNGHSRRGDLIRGVAMSMDDTGARQLDRLEEAGLRVRHLPLLTDVDTIADAHSVAATVPNGRFARTLAALLPGATAARTDARPADRDATGAVATGIPVRA